MTSAPPGHQLGSSRQTPYYAITYGTIAIARDLGPSAYLLYTYLSLRLGRNETAWPSYRRIADDTGMTDKTIKRAIDTLIANDLLEVERHGIWNRQHYILHDPKPLPDPVRLESSPKHYDPKRTREDAASTGEIPTGNGSAPTGEIPAAPTGEIPVTPTGEIPVKEDTEKVSSGKQHHYAESSATPRSARNGRDVLAAFVDRRGQQAIDPAIIGMQSGIARRLITGTKRRAPYTYEDITGCMDYLQTGTRPWDMRTLDTTLPTWIADGRPAKMHASIHYQTHDQRTDDAFAQVREWIGGNGTAARDPEPDPDFDDADIIDV